MRKMSRTARAGRLTQTVFSLLLVIALLCGMGVSSFAVTTADLDLDESGSVTVTFKDGDAAMMDGALTAYPVAELKIDDDWNMYYAPTGCFEGSGIVLDEDSLSDNSALAGELLGILPEDAEGITAVIEDGTAVFTDLPLGVYLIVQTASAAGFYDINPFVVTVPVLEGDEWVCDVIADTKVEQVDAHEKTVDADGNGDFNDEGQLVGVGQELTYKIDYENTTGQEAVVEITDVLEAGLTYVEGSASDGGIYDESTRAVTWTFTVPAGEKGSVTFKAVVNENARVDAGLSNTGSVKVGDNPAVSTNPAYNPLSDKLADTDGDGVFDDAGGEIQVGDTITYEITYTNGHSTDASVTITDVLEEGLDFVAFVSPGGIGSYDHGVYDEETRTITWIIEDVAPGESGSVYFIARVNENALGAGGSSTSGGVSNSASVQVGHDPVVETSPVENFFPGEPEEPEKGVAVGGTEENGAYGDNGKPVQVGDELTYQITYYNYHAVPATVVVVDELDEGLTYVEGSASDGGVYDKDTRTITWTMNAEAFERGEVTFTAVVSEDASVAGEVENTAGVSIGENSWQTNTVDNPVPGGEEPSKSVDINGAGTFNGNGEPVAVGDILTYRICYYNSHRFQRTVTITDTLDENVRFVSASGSYEYDEATHTVTWTIDNVSGRTGGVVTVDVEVLEGALVPGEVDNAAFVQVGNDTAVETNPVHNPVPSLGDLSVGKKISGSSAHVGSSAFDFRITLTDADGAGISDTFRTEYSTGETGSLTFEDGVAEISLVPWQTVTVKDIPADAAWSVEELNVDDQDVLLDDGTELLHSVTVTANGVVTEATAGIGTVEDSSEVIFINSYREYFGIDEEIVTDEENIFNRDSWVKDEAVNEYNAIEIEMTTTLPIITVEDLTSGEYTMKFHNVLDSELNLDEVDADFSVYIGGVQVGHQYYTVYIGEETGDSCSFHVEVDLTALYNDGIITEEDLQGNTEITIFFFADLEGTGLNGSYKSTVWYQIYDDDELLYTSNVDVVYVYTFEIEIRKINGLTDVALAGAEFGLYYDEACEDPVIRNGEPYTEVSDSDGMTIFYGLADGTYRVTELAAPEGYELRDEVIEVVLGLDTTVDYAYALTFENFPGEAPGPTPEPGEPTKTVDTDGDGVFGDEGGDVAVGDSLTYEISYYSEKTAEVIITDTLSGGLTFVSASDGGGYDPSTGTVTWVLDAEAGSSGSVTVMTEVNGNALALDEIHNTASVQVGDDPAVETNSVGNPVEPEEPGDEAAEPTPEPGGGTVEPTPEPGGEETPEPSDTSEPTPTPTASDEAVTAPDDTTTTTPGSSTTTTTTTGGGTTWSSGTSETLPQTGMIFWPIIVLAIAGAALITVGLILRRRRNA